MSSAIVWPSLPYSSRRDTAKTLQLWSSGSGPGSGTIALKLVTTNACWSSGPRGTHAPQAGDCCSRRAISRLRAQKVMSRAA